MAALFLIVTIFFWGTGFRATAIGLEHASPVMLTALRAAPAALALLLAVALLRGRSLPPRPLWVATALTGILTVTVTLEGMSEGTARAGAANAAVLLNASPLFVAVLGRVFLRERVPLPASVGLVLGFAGIVVMVSTQLGGIEDSGEFALGMGFSLAGALGWAIGVLVTKGLFTRHPDLDMVGLTTAQYLVGAATLLPLAFALDGTGRAAWGAADLWWAVAWIALGASALATLTFFGALRRMAAARATAWQFLAPVVAVVVEVVYGDAPTAIVMVGMGLAIAGVALVSAAPLLTNGRRLPWPSSATTR